MNDLSPELAAFAALLDAQPAPARDAFNYCLCLLMVEADKMRLAETLPGESGEICVFETTVGDRFSVVRPAMSEKDEATLRLTICRQCKPPQSAENDTRVQGNPCALFVCGKILLRYQFHTSSKEDTMELTDLVSMFTFPKGGYWHQRWGRCEQTRQAEGEECSPDGYQHALEMVRILYHG